MVTGRRKKRGERRLTFLGAVVAPEQIAKLDQLATRAGRSRSGMLRLVIDVGVSAIVAAQAGR